ncbi:hypothetical protein D9758_002447 [Tetrapyrgos nigripes]|uniref:DUF3074 domain-containing protein n=1 Tax=Tetrapyrgos nigripes TaxID=182062 RepID=A0A8H5GPX7_9AGAR|nr:hypothetical protein D9758_002447 [Tetrapyrgos nigripes]
MLDFFFNCQPNGLACDIMKLLYNVSLHFSRSRHRDDLFNQWAPFIISTFNFQGMDITKANQEHYITLVVTCRYGDDILTASSCKPPADLGLNMTNNFELTISSPLKPAGIPLEDAVIAAGRELLASTASWKQGKTYRKVVKTLSRAKDPRDAAGWHCRVSEHKPEEAKFDEMWETLGKNNAMTQLQFVPEIKEAIKVKEISPTASIWSFTYKLPPPFSPRVYTVLQVTHLDDVSPRSVIVVSVPIDLSEDPGLAESTGKGVKGRYVVVERFMELENGNTEWRMATTGTAGGSIPAAIVEWTMASKISEDVPNFMRWLRRRKLSK